MSVSPAAVRVEAGGWTGVKILLRLVRLRTPPLGLFGVLLSLDEVVHFLGCSRHRRRVFRPQGRGNPDERTIQVTNSVRMRVYDVKGEGSRCGSCMCRRRAREGGGVAMYRRRKCRGGGGAMICVGEDGMKGTSYL